MHACCECILLRDALDSMYARAMTLQIRACCNARCTAGLHFGHGQLKLVP